MTDERQDSSDKNEGGVSRREFLNYAWLASLGFLTVTIGGVGLVFAMPRVREGEFGGNFDMGPITALVEPESPPENFPEGKFWLSRTDEGLYALYKVCTHLDCLFNWDPQEGRFVCPCHGSQFEQDGSYISGPAPRSLDQFVIRLLGPDGRVVAETDPNIGGPLVLPGDIASVCDCGETIEGPSVITLGELSLDVTQVSVQVDTGQRILGKPAVDGEGV